MDKGKQMKIWLDDVRPPPDESWRWLKTAIEIILVFAKDYDLIEEMSLDHDLYDGHTGYYVVEWIETKVAEGEITHLPKTHVHSMNPVGAERMRMCLKSIERMLEGE